MGCVSNLVALHLGTLHPVEQALTLALAFGPFIVLGIVIALRRRAEARADTRTAEERSGAGPVDVLAERRDQRER